MMRKLYHHVPNAQKLLISNLLRPHISRTVDLKMLTMDPVSLNLQTPATPSNFVKARVNKRFINATWITNNEIRKLTDLAKQQEESKLFDHLKTLRPCNSRILNAIYNATVEGHLQKYLARIANTVSIVERLTYKGGDRLLRSVGHQEYSYFQSVLYIFESPNEGIIWNSTICSVDHAQKLREISWNMGIIEGVSIPSPVELFTLVPLSSARCQLCFESSITRNYTSYKSKYPENRRDLWNKIGVMKPYLGSSTQSKVEIADNIDLKTADPYFKDLLLLLSTLNWCIKADSSLGSFIKNVFKAGCELDPDSLILDEKMISGSTAHRFQDSSTSHGGFSTNLYQPFTHIMMTTNTMLDYRKSSKNTNLQCSMLFGQFLFCDMLLHNHALTTCAHYHTTCTCIKPLNEELMNTTEDISNLQVSSCKDSNILYIPSKVIRSEVQADYLVIKELTSYNEGYLRDQFFALSMVEHLTHDSHTGDVTFLDKSRYLLY